MENDGRPGPLITVAMPVYNGGAELLPALRSVVGQTYTRWELLLIDDGSTDGAAERAYAAVADPRIRLIRDGRNLGLTARLNQAIDLAAGELLARMDQDDICYPARFERQVALLQRNSDLDLVAVRSLAISATGEPLGYFPYRLTHEEIVASPWNGFYLPHPTWMGRIEWFRRHRYTTYHCEDQGLLLRTYATSRFATVPEVLFAYRLRTAFSWRKTVALRKTLLRLQLARFRSPLQIGLCLMALLAFVAKTVRDAWVAFAYRRSPMLVRNSGDVAAADLAQWRAAKASAEGMRP